MSNIAMLNGKPKPEIANVKKRLDSVFGPHDKFSEIINSAVGLTSSIYGVPSSSSFNPMGHRAHHISSTPYLMSNSQASNSNVSYLKTGSDSSAAYGMMILNDGSGYSTTNIPRPPTKEVLQSMQSLVKDQLLKNLECSTNMCCIVEDHSVPSTSKNHEKVQKNTFSPKIASSGYDRKRLVQEDKYAEVKMKKSKKEGKDLSGKSIKHDDKSHAVKLNRELQEELFGDFLSDEDSNQKSSKSLVQELENIQKKTSPSPPLPILSASAASLSFALENRLSPLPTLSKPERDLEKPIKTNSSKSEKSATNSIIAYNKENSNQNAEGNSPRIVIKISRPSSNCSLTPPPSLLHESTDKKERKEKRKKKEKEKNQKSIEPVKDENRLPLHEENVKCREQFTKSFSTAPLISGELLKAGKSVTSTMSPESNDLHSPDSGFVDVMSNGTSSSLNGSMISNKMILGKPTSLRNFDSKADVGAILEQFGRVSPLLSPIRNISSPVIELGIRSPFSSNKTIKTTGLFFEPKVEARKLQLTNPSTSLVTFDNIKIEDTKYEENVIKQELILLKSSTTEDSSINDFTCQLKLGNSTTPLLEVFSLNGKSKIDERSKKSKKKVIATKLECIDEEGANFLSERADDSSSGESELTQKQAIFEQRIKIKDEIIQSHELVIAEQRTRLKNFDKKSKLYAKEIESNEKTITALKKENKELAKRNLLLTGKMERMSLDREKMTKELEDLRKQLHYRS